MDVSITPHTGAQYWNTIKEFVETFGLKILLALVFWFVGDWIIGKLVRIVKLAMEKHNTDKTLCNYLKSISSIALRVVLIIGIMGFVGIQTTTFTAIVAASGLALGMAWSGLLANFAAGAFIMFLRPFKVGDFVSVGDVSGVVKEIGIFTTSLNTPDNVLTLVGNNQVFSNTIRNFTVNSYRRVDTKIVISPCEDLNVLRAKLRERILAIPNVIQEKGVDMVIPEIGISGPVLSVRPYCEAKNYWQVYFATTEIIKEYAVYNTQLGLIASVADSINN